MNHRLLRLKHHAIPLAFSCIACVVMGCPLQKGGPSAPSPIVEQPKGQPKVSSGPSPGEDAENVNVITTYSGVCFMNPATPANPAGDMTGFPIYSQSDFEKFIGRIPENLPSKTNPPPKNDDPLLEKPKIDFEKNMALVLLNPDSLSSKPRVLSIREDAKTMWIEAEHPAKLPGEVYSDGMGTYTIVIIPFSGEMKTTSFGFTVGTD